jgi:hypothetical protein
LIVKVAAAGARWEVAMTAPSARKQWAAMTSDEKLDFLFEWCTNMDRTIESEKVQMQARSARIRAVEEKLGPLRH